MFKSIVQRSFKYLSVKRVLVSILIATVVIWNIVYPSGTWRYKITVNVETPEGLKSGSAVREVYVADAPDILPEAHNSVKLKGEAVVVDLGARGVLFAPLNIDDYSIVFKTFPIPGEIGRAGGTTPKGIRYFRSLKNVNAVLPVNHYPRFVMFKNINDPLTVTPVLEYSDYDQNLSPHRQKQSIKADHFEELFGQGVRLKSVTIEMTDEKITWSIAQRLPWLSQYFDKTLDGQTTHTIDTNYPLANSLGSGSFSTRKP